MHFFLATNSLKDTGLTYSSGLAAYIRSKGATASILTATQDHYGNYHFTIPKHEDAIVLALGGDGTILICVNDLNLSGLDYPILGINLGTTGFLTQVEKENGPAAVDAILQGRYVLERYPLLSAELHNERVDFSQQALNDVVVGRQGFARVLGLKVCIDGYLAYEASCDGIVVSTALGATAYNLSLGGPIVPPGTPVLVITPIAPHLPGIRPIIVPDSSRITIELSGERAKQPREGIISCDGRGNGIWLEKDDCVEICKHHSGGRLLKLQNSQSQFFDVFREKLLTVR